jgi:serine/threonine-protein kinase
MDAEVERLFNAALELQPDARGPFLDDACSDALLRREVESLLAADAAAANGFLEVPAFVVPPQRIGPYRLLRVIGEGGTSTVHLAVREDQYRQRVAIKLIKPGMDSRQILARFHQERQILASLSHPNIARLLDGGTTAAGHPYFVMEYVEGSPLDVHVAKLSLAARLELFRSVCQAVHYAHRNLVVHRDLKPSNILVRDDGVPKLVDFGIAKLLNPELAGLGAEPTATMFRLMTPAYASPEQVQGKAVGVPSDIYSLGVILYRLSTGERPYEIDTGSPHKIERVVCEVNPPPPSTRAKEKLPRDLDSIVLMAMHKEPERRYDSAHELGEDVRRCLERRPVLARRATLGYRAWSLLRRKPGFVAAALLVAASVVGAAAATCVAWKKAVVQRARADEQRVRAEETLQFIVALFKIENAATNTAQLSVDELLARGSERVRRDFADRPELQATLEHTLGVVHANIGAYDRAAALFAEAVAARSAGGGAATLDLADSLLELGMTRMELGTPFVAEPHLQRALQIREQLLGRDHLLVADVLDVLADLKVELNSPSAEGYARRALEIRRRRLGESDPRLAASMDTLANIFRKDGRYDEAEPLATKALDMRRRAPGDHLDELAASYNLLGLLRFGQGYYDEAERFTNLTIEYSRRAYGPDHPHVVDMQSILVGIWREQGRYDEAEALARKSLAARLALRGKQHPAIDNALHHLARVLEARGKLGEAEDLASQALEMREREYGRFHDSVGHSRWLLGRIKLDTGEPQAAETYFRDALEIWQKMLGPEHPVVATAMVGIAQALTAEGRRDEARRWAREALALEQRRLRAGHPEIAETLTVLAELAPSPAQAEPLLQQALTIDRVVYPAGHPRTTRVERLLEACMRQHSRATAVVSPSRPR